MFKNYYQQMEFAKENNYYSMKHLKKRSTIVYNKINRKKICDLRDAKEHF